MHILDWLDTITFPNEARFADPAYARRVYASCVDGFLRQGVTTASYYGSVHGEATKILAGLCWEKGQRALVGKCNMTRGSPDFYRDASVAESLAVTEDCVEFVRGLDPEGKLVRYVLTPRFAISFHEAGIKVGLGTDSGGGFSSSILDAMRQAMIASYAREAMSKGQDKGLSIAEAFYLATLGGAQVCGLEGRVGNFEVGKDFDALVIETQGRDQDIMTMVEEEDSLKTVFEKFVMTGDDRNIIKVYVQGRLVKGEA
ncbi:hypothetical protein N0V88_008037 [Collariella sp. IMI 366227]|nr:hypothetical protein N0V88_008037 [Collariella sp. IMI 366227]